MPTRRCKPHALRRPGALLVTLALCGAGSGLAAGTTRAMGTPPAAELLLGGFVALDETLTSRWCWSGSWVFPVGDSCLADTHGEPPYAVNRGIEDAREGFRGHQGVDLCNRRGGGIVRAAAAGMVVRAVSATRGGYGAHVVLAHRLEEGGLAYSVYSHLIRSSVTLAGGEMVAAGQPLGRVGRSGRASTSHLHFEIRIAADPGLRWERCRVIDPLPFIESRRSCRSGDSTWARPYLEWAERTALVTADTRGDQPLRRHAWWLMLARAARHPLEDLPRGAQELRRVLIENRLVPDDEPASDGAMDWKEAVRDLERLREAGLRVPAFTERLAARADGDPLESSSRGTGWRALGSPSIADACQALASLSGALQDQPLGAHDR